MGKLLMNTIVKLISERLKIDTKNTRKREQLFDELGRRGRLSKTIMFKNFNVKRSMRKRENI